MSIKLISKRRFVETELEHWNDISKLNPRFLSGFVFRGMGDHEWHIESSLERMIKRFHLQSEIAQKVYPQGYEIDMLKEFQWKYPKYAKKIIPNADNVIEWLSIMQHYGSPTRMVDFTYSPYIALFMAMDTSGEKHDASIWCLNEIILRNILCDKYEKSNNKRVYDIDVQKSIIYEEANQKISDSVNETRKDFSPNVYLVQPHKVNERILVQQGLFAIPEKIGVPFEDNLFSLVDNRDPEVVPFKDVIEYSNSDKMFKPYDYFLIKIRVPLKFRLDIIKSLYLMNISAETMYPGFEGLAKSLNRQRYAG